MMNTKKAFSLLICLTLLFQLILPAVAYAEELDGVDPVICAHHIHDELCGYDAASEGITCGFRSENCEICTPTGDGSETDHATVLAAPQLTRSVNVLELDIANGSIVIAANGATQNGSLISDSVGKQYVITGTGAANQTVTVNAAADIIFENVTMQTQQSAEAKAGTANYNKDLNPVAINTTGVNILLSGENTLTTDHYYNAAIYVKAGAALSIDSADVSGSVQGTLKVKTTMVNDDLPGHNAGLHERYPAAAIGDNGGTSGSRGNPYSNNTASAKANFTLNIKGGTYEVAGFSTVFGNRPKNSFDKSALAATVNISGGTVTGSGHMTGEFSTTFLVNAKAMEAKFTASPTYKGTLSFDTSSGLSNLVLTGSLSIGDNAASGGNPILLKNITMLDDGTRRSAGISVGENSAVVLEDCTLKISSIGSYSDLTIKNCTIDTQSSVRLDNMMRKGASATPLEMRIEDSGITVNAASASSGISVYAINSTQNVGGNLTIHNSDIKIAISSTGSASMPRYAVNVNGNITVTDSDLVFTTDAVNYDASRNGFYAMKDGDGNGGNIHIKNSSVVNTISNMHEAASMKTRFMYAAGSAVVENSELKGNGIFQINKDLTYKNSIVINDSDSAVSYAEELLTVENSFINTPMGYVQGNAALDIKGNSFVSCYYLRDSLDKKINNSVVLSNVSKDAADVITPLKEGVTYGEAVLQFDGVGTTAIPPDEKIAPILEVPQGYTLKIEADKGGKITLGGTQTMQVNGAIENQSGIALNDRSKLVLNNSVQNEAAIEITPNATLELQADGVLKNFQTGSMIKNGTLTNNGKLSNSVLFTVNKNNAPWAGFDNSMLGLKKDEDKLTAEIETSYDGTTSAPVVYAPSSEGKYLVYHSSTFVEGNSEVVPTTVEVISQLSPLQMTADFYDVTFNDNTATRAVPETRTLLNGSKYALPVPNREGYTFKGWNTQTDGKGTTLTDETPLALTAETTLYAQWKSSGGGGSSDTYYTVKYEVGANGTLQGSASQSVVSGGKPTRVPTVTANEGFVFEGWTTDGGKTLVDPATVAIHKNITFTAAYAKAEKPVEKPIEKPPLATLNKIDHVAYMIGDDMGLFRPESPITRAEAAMLFARLTVQKFDESKVYPTTFPDVAVAEWFAGAVGYMQALGVVTGYPDGNFYPGKPISRAEFAAMASRFDALTTGGEHKFSDVASDHWAADYIASADAKGWVIGYEDGTFRPENEIIRAEVVTLVNRMLERVADRAYIAAHPDQVRQFPDVPQSHWAYYNILEASNAHSHTNENGERWTGQQLK